MARLTACEGRVVASLVEKQLTIPQHYPLTLHTLVAACNQSSSRDPVTDYGDDEVLAAVESLKAKRLVRAVLPSHGRSVVRYRHVADEALGLDAPQLAVLATLELRGPQTAAELRARAERMADLESIDHELDLLATRDDPLVGRASRRPGQKEDRWESLLAEPFATGPVGGAPAARAETGAATAAVASARDGVPATPPRRDGSPDLRTEVEGLRGELDGLRAELETLRAEVGALRSGVDDLRTSLGG